MKPAIDYRLYLVADVGCLASSSVEDAVAQACAGGVTIVQLRDKGASPEELLELAQRVKEVCDACGVALIINDNPHVAARVQAAGVHVGQGDMNPREVRRIVGDDAIIGVSAHNVAEALAAQGAGADYLGVGAMVPTATKPDAHVTSREELARILGAVDIPCVAIGGIDEGNIASIAATGVAGCAVASAIIAASDVRAATLALREAIGS